MRVILIIVSILVTSELQAQGWQTIYQDDFPDNALIANWSGAGKQRFQINPIDNSIWMIGSQQVTHIDGNGNYQRFDTDNHLVLVDDNYYNALAFANGEVQLLNKYTGLFSYDGTNWTLDHSIYFGETLATDGDTIWVGEDDVNTDARRIINGSFINLPFSAKNIASKNGQLWYNIGANIIYRYFSGSTGEFFTPDNSDLLSWNVNDFKFHPTTDTLYIATDVGISIVFDTTFVDSITPSNTVNMPGYNITEFEFDTQGNIWALFSNSSIDHTHLAYLDRSLMEWTTIYDDSNSPLTWDSWMTFEVDNMGNVWVPSGREIDVLKVNPPTWLGNESLELATFNIFPNPSEGEITFEIDNNTQITDILITDVNGKTLLNQPYTQSINTDLVSGIYFVHLINHKSHIATQKVIIK